MSAATVPALQRALAEVAVRAGARDRAPGFPIDAMTSLARGGGLEPPRAISHEWKVVRAIAQADGSVGRIVDGHYTRSSGSSCWPRSRYAAPTSRRSRRGSAGWACGAPTR